MRKADLRKNHDEFENVIDEYVYFLGRVFKSKELLTTADKRKVAESSLLRICACWESFVEKELVDCTNIDCSRLAAHVDVTLPKHLTLAMCQAILFGGRYSDFRSVGDLRGFAKKVLPDDVNPFAKIAPATGQRIDDNFTMRNYLSHQSKVSRRTLMRMYSDRYNLQRFKAPGAFLLAKGYRRLADSLAAFKSASRQMASIISE